MSPRVGSAKRVSGAAMIYASCAPGAAASGRVAAATPGQRLPQLPLDNVGEAQAHKGRMRGRPGRTREDAS